MLISSISGFLLVLYMTPLECDIYTITVAIATVIVNINKFCALVFCFDFWSTISQCEAPVVHL